MSKKNVNIVAAALAAIANELNEPMEKTDQATGEIVTANSMGFAQRRVLNGICYSIELTLDGTRQSLDKALTELRTLARSNRDDEIGLKNIATKQQWIERLEMQEAVLAKLFDEAVTAHSDHTAEQYVPVKQQRAERERAKREQTRNPVLQAAQRMLERHGIKDVVHDAPGAYDASTQSSDPGQRAA